MKIVIDTNVIFSALLKTNTTFGDIIFNSDGIFEFYCPHYLRTEIRKHWDRLKRISRLNDDQLNKAYDALLTKITFLNEEIIPRKIWEESALIAEGIDLDDTDFIAMTKFLRGKLWTGDQQLLNGLKNKGFRNVLSTADIQKRWLSKRKK